MRNNPALLSAVTCVLAVAGLTAVQAETSPFAGLIGSWRGSGEIRLDDGKSEKLKCQAYYTQRDSAQNLGLAIRCASASYTIELRSQLTAQGSSIRGNWEERTFNAAGSVTGEAKGTSITLNIVGGGFSGSMAVSTTGTSQSVTVATSGNALKGVSIQLTKS
jgi:hypothetical protein